jgi:hypothetical protein
MVQVLDAERRSTQGSWLGAQEDQPSARRRANGTESTPGTHPPCDRAWVGRRHAYQAVNAIVMGQCKRAEERELYLRMTVRERLLLEQLGGHRILQQAEARGSKFRESRRPRDACLTSRPGTGTTTG